MSEAVSDPELDAIQRTVEIQLEEFAWDNYGLDLVDETIRSGFHEWCPALARRIAEAVRDG
jgi:hypothetical protein